MRLGQRGLGAVQNMIQSTDIEGDYPPVRSPAEGIVQGDVGLQEALHPLPRAPHRHGQAHIQIAVPGHRGDLLAHIHLA